MTASEEDQDLHHIDASACRVVCDSKPIVAEHELIEQVTRELSYPSTLILCAPMTVETPLPQEMNPNSTCGIRL